MSDEHLLNGLWNIADEEDLEPLAEQPPESPDDEFEEITVDEVDRVVATLDELIQTVDSENIKWILEDAIDGVSDLLYEEDEEETGEESARGADAA